MCTRVVWSLVLPLIMRVVVVDGCLQSWNPFALGAMFCGEGLFIKCIACICCIGIVLACVFGAPFINVAVQVYVGRR